MDYYLEKGRQTLSSMFSSPPPPVRYNGLINQGETCYLNSVLQVLFMTEDFREAVEKHCFENPATECIDRHLKDLFDDLNEQTAYTYNITRKLGIQKVHEQQDAAEYYEKILSLTSPDASQIFHGWLTDRTTCSSCGTQTDTDGAFWHLPLALVDSYSEYSVVNGIKEHFKASEFSGENQMYCEQCDAKCDATIQCVMKHHPEVLMLLLKRFDFDYRYMTYVKINQTVDVPRTIQIPENQTYELYAVVDHSGDLRSGCYTATIWDDENWFNFSDIRVTLADYQPFQVDNFEKSSSAYLLFYRKKNATQPPSPVSAPEGHQPATIDVYDQGQDLGKRRGREDGEAIDRDEETERVGSRGVELQPDPRHYENDQDTIPHIHQLRNEERNDKNHLQDTQAEEHRDEGEILLSDKERMGGNAEPDNRAGEMEALCRETQHEESIDDQGSRKEGTQDVSDDLKPEISDMLAKDAHLRKEVQMSDDERGVMDVKTGEDKQSQKEEKSLTIYLVDNAGENIDENLMGTQEGGRDYDLKSVSEDEQRDERGVRIEDKEEKTEAGGGAPEIGGLNHHLFSSEIQECGSRKQNMPKDDNQQGEERTAVQEVEGKKRGDDKHAQGRDTSVTERYPSEGVQAQDSDGVRRVDVSGHPEQKISIRPTVQKDVELDKKGKTEVHKRGMGSGSTRLLKIYDLVHSSEIQDDRRVDDNKQKMPKDDQRCKEGGSSRHEGREQERGVRRDVEGVTEQKRGDSEQPYVGQDVEDQSFVGLHDRQRMSEQKISGTYTNRKDGSEETQSKHIENRSDCSLRRAGSTGSSKPTEWQGVGCGEKVRWDNSQERPGSKSIEVKTIDKEIRSETVPRSSVVNDLKQAGSAEGRTPTENQGAGCGEQVRQINPQTKATCAFPESTREERSGSKNIVIKITETEIRRETIAGISVEGNLSKRFAQLKVNESPHTKPKKRASKNTVLNSQEEETNRANKRKLSDTGDQENKKDICFGPSVLPKKKPREKEEKNTTDYSFRGQENVDSD